MNESRFIELLNLYVDHQLSTSEAAELEAEVQKSPERRRMYAQYCRMQKACTLLFESERAHAPKTAAAIMAARQVEVARTDRPTSGGRALVGSKVFPLFRFPVLGGLAAAAACIVFVSARLTQGPTNGPASFENSGLVSAQAPASSITLPSSPVAIAALPSGAEIPVSIPVAVEGTPKSAFRSVLITNSLRQRGAELDTDVHVLGDSPDPMLEWARRIELPPVRVNLGEELAFEARPSLQQPETPVFRGRNAIRGGANAELTAFQFQR